MVNVMTTVVGEKFFFFPKSNKLSNFGIRCADVIPVHKGSLLTVNIVM